MCYTASLDTYTWDLGGLVDANETNVLYWSADKSAVTLVAPDFGDTDFISVVLGSCNNSSHNLLTRSIYGKPAEPIINVPTCWEDSETITLSLDNYDTDVTYTWVLNNDTLATNSTTSSIDVNINDNPLFRAYSEFEVIVYADPIGGSCFGAVSRITSYNVCYTKLLRIWGLSLVLISIITKSVFEIFQETIFESDYLWLILLNMDYASLCFGLFLIGLSVKEKYLTWGITVSMSLIILNSLF